jgi:hypothetical protein
MEIAKLQKDDAYYNLSMVIDVMNSNTDLIINFIMTAEE